MTHATNGRATGVPGAARVAPGTGGAAPEAEHTARNAGPLTAKRGTAAAGDHGAATTRAKLRGHRAFGLLDTTPFSEVLAFVERHGGR